MAKIEAYGIVLYKIEKGKTKILLCKSVKSREKWGCLKGVKTFGENSRECAKREFLEECSIKVETFFFEEYFEQRNDKKNIGVWIVDANKISKIDEYFVEDKLLEKYLSWENSKAKFFDIDNLPPIKTKQIFLIKKITDFLRNKSQFH
ncbi:NUDIX hydrolase [Halarcobacter ebronensis]|uniref:NUDIX hydrolase n=1 Tax=Halarcobacter ebronensis TaxID=1462615 RepID=A0A4Q1AKI8_9BACT|nr:NUDIX domain-containing protein [Halarcobacter ebronensis]QKF81379.1 putative diadenosine tetraphosphate hydrolase [Halarcobacter ebronensis]RXK04939.1 NUDIX hydrolase [Halarcobacter ebronensis]